MAVEESSVVAAASHGTSSREPGWIYNKSWHPSAPVTKSSQLARISISSQTLKEKILQEVDRGQDRLIARGGGAKKFPGVIQKNKLPNLLSRR